ncbi:hypothetical protein [Neorhizobium sp. DAR64861/K0K2]|uniref:hypothetical protein n=1 Tax=unclassified Neorhizobium TaxID=2629175 RepID=UPI003D2CD9B2
MTDNKTPSPEPRLVESRPSLRNVATPDVTGDSSSGPSIVSSEVDAVLGLNIVTEQPREKCGPNDADQDDGLRNGHMPSFQLRVSPWMMACFGPMIAGDREERNHRFLEEALELVQSTGCTVSEAHQLVDYVYGRALGEPSQEVGGVMVTLAALCLANALDMHDAGETELARIWTKVEQIRAKQAAKPKHSPLPGPSNGGVGR